MKVLKKLKILFPKTIMTMRRPCMVCAFAIIRIICLASYINILYNGKEIEKY